MLFKKFPFTLCLALFWVSGLAWAAPVSFTFTSTQVTCNGGTNGTITVNATGGVPPYQFSNDNGQNFQTGNVFSGLAAAQYPVLVKDAAGALSSIKNILISQPNAIGYTTQLTNPACYGAATGRIYFVPTGGIGPFNYTINGGVSWQSSANFTLLVAGSYTVQVRDSRGCLGEMRQVSLTQPTRLVTTTTVQDESCFQARDGVININGTGGVPPYQYTINNGQTWQANPVFSGLSAASTYIVKIKDAANCQSDIRGATVGGPSKVNFSLTSLNPTCFGAYDGQISVAPTGGHHAYVISIDSGRTFLSQTVFGGLPAGVYDVLVKDNQGCVGGYQQVVLTQPSELIMDMIPSIRSNGFNLSCNVANGTPDGELTAQVSGGTPPYNYMWSNGQNSASINGLGAGTFSLTVTDAAGCSNSASITLTQPGEVTANFSIVNESCFEAADGRITVAGAGGVPPYQYSINNGQTWQGNPEFAGVVASANYVVRVKDASGCTSQPVAALVGGPANPLTFTETVQNLTCFNVNTGRITVAPSGGNGGYAISIDGGQSFQAQMSFGGLGAGMYEIVVRDASGCMSNPRTVEILQPAGLIVDVEPAFRSGGFNLSCNGQNGNPDGQVAAMVSGGTAPYHYLWSSGHTTASASGLAAGNYSLTVTDATGCTESVSMNLTQPQPLLAVPVGCQKVVLGHASSECVTLNLQVASGGKAPFTYSWRTGQTGQSIQVCPTQSTIYEGTITDANGCKVVNSYRIAVLDARCGNQNQKVLVCHVPPNNPGNPQEVCVTASEASAHLNGGTSHGACFIGPCGIPDPCNYTPTVKKPTTSSSPSTSISQEGMSYTQMLFEKSKMETPAASNIDQGTKDILKSGVLRSETETVGAEIRGEKLESGGVKIIVKKGDTPAKGEELVIRDMLGNVLETKKVEWSGGKFQTEFKGQVKGESITVTLRSGEQVLANKVLKIKS